MDDPSPHPLLLYIKVSRGFRFQEVSSFKGFMFYWFHVLLVSCFMGFMFHGFHVSCFKVKVKVNLPPP